MKDSLLPLRCAQAIFAMTTMVLIAYVADWWGQIHRAQAPAEVNFLVFTSIFSLLCVVFCILIQTERFSRFNSQYFIVGIDALLMTCWFGGFVALPVFLKQRICFGNVCRMAYASVVFAALEWLLFAATMCFTAFFALRKRRTSPATPPQKEWETDIETFEVVIEAKR